MSRSPQFESERAELERVVEAMDAERVRHISLREARRAVLAAHTCSLDIVTDLATPVGCALIREYFGVGNSEDLVEPLRRLGAMIAAPASELDTFRRQAEQSASQVFDQIDKDIAEAVGRLRGLPHLHGDATVLERLVHGHLTGGSGLDLEGVRRNITGVLLPGSALVTRAFATSLVQLLKHKRLRTTAVAAAHRRDWLELEGCLLEALRFHPVFPVLPRYCPHDTAVPGFNGEYRVKGGRVVFVAVASAMFDRHAELFAGATGGHPAEARLRDPHHYRHFGGGAHMCLGQRVALPQMAAMLAAVLTLPRLKCGTLAYSDDGISPRTLVVTFARHATSGGEVPAGDTSAVCPEPVDSTDAASVTLAST
jgi:cytochrome P450